MSERQLQFRVGLFVLAALVVCGVMVFQFGEIQSFWEPRYTVSIHFDAAPGVYPETPVRRNGVTIGKVQQVSFDEKRGGVIVVVEIRDEYRLREDTQPRLVQTLLGDASIEFTPGQSPRILHEGSLLEGEPPTDPLQIVDRLEEKVTITLDSFHATSREWQQVGRNLNALLETNEGNLNLVIERTAEALQQFTLTMQNAETMIAQTNRIVGDPQNQENLRKSLAALPELVEETRQTITAVKLAVAAADDNLNNLRRVTGPLANKSTSIVTRLDNTLANLESLSQELSDFAQLAAKEDGTLRRFATDPDLYRNLNRSAESMTVLLRNLEPVLRDLRIFSDKVARHPELMGVSGALNGSSGLKDPPPEEPVPRSAGRLREPK